MTEGEYFMMARNRASLSLRAISSRRRSVTSRAAPYTRRRLRSTRVVHSSHRHWPSRVQNRIWVRPTSPSAANSASAALRTARSSGWTRSSSRRPTSSWGPYPRVRSKAVFHHTRAPSKSVMQKIWADRSRKVFSCVDPAPSASVTGVRCVLAAGLGVATGAGAASLPASTAMSGSRPGSASGATSGAASGPDAGWARPPEVGQPVAHAELPRGVDIDSTTRRSSRMSMGLVR